MVDDLIASGRKSYK